MATSDTGHLTPVEAAVVARKRVYKYGLELTSGPQPVEMPIAGSIVHVHEQNDRPCLWAAVNTTSPAATRIFWVFATGEDIPIRVNRYIGTIHVGWTVWHIYEEV